MSGDGIDAPSIQDDAAAEQSANVYITTILICSDGMRYPKEKKNGAGGSLRKTSRFQLNPKRYASTGP